MNLLKLPLADHPVVAFVSRRSKQEPTQALTLDPGKKRLKLIPRTKIIPLECTTKRRRTSDLRACDMEHRGLGDGGTYQIPKCPFHFL